MALLIPRLTITFYPVAYPTETGGVTLLSGDHYLEAGAGLSALLAQTVQRASFLRATEPEFYVRGDHAATMDWEEIRAVDHPATGLADALSEIAAISDETGWLRIDFPTINRAFAVKPAAIRSGGVKEDRLRGALRLKWIVEAGTIVEIPGDYSDENALLMEDGFPILLETGDPNYVLLEMAS